MPNRKQNKDVYDVVIIGAGPAGFSAAIYTSRANLKTLVFGKRSGSNVHKAHVIENYFGVKPISGAMLLKISEEKIRRNGAKLIKKEVAAVQRNKAGFFIVTDEDKKEYRARAIIVCTGFSFKPTGIKNEQTFIGKGVSYCVACDGPFFKNTKIAVVGNTNFAGCEALHLKAYSSNISIVSHGYDFKISGQMRRRLKKENISILKTPKIKEFYGAAKLSKIIYADNKEENFDGVFVALGVAGAFDFANQLGLERHGPQNAFLKIDPRTCATNAPGVFAAGDCTGGYAQVAKSAGEGCVAAISVIEFLKGIQKYVDY